MRLPAWIVAVLRGLTVAVVAVFALATTLVVAVMPYRLWDSLAFGSWSRSIAETGELWDNAGALYVSRPLFYVPQGWLWRFLTEDEWMGRLLSATFAAVLVAAVWLLARQLSSDRAARELLPALSVVTLLSSAVLGAYVAAGMTDVPVAAASAATAVVLWSALPAYAALPLAALGGAATILAKPSGLLALAGLLLATVVLRGRAALIGVVGACTGMAVGLAYDAWQADRLGTAFSDLLRAGNDDFWLQRGAAARWDTLVAGDWLGDGARTLVLYGLTFAVARVVGAGARPALAVAAGVALTWSVVGPIAADDDLGYPFDGSAVGIAAWLVLAGTLIAAPFAPVEEPVSRRGYAALLVWLAPVGVAWASQRPDEARLLAPAWPAFALLSAAALTTASLALLRARPAAGVVPMIAVAVIAVMNVVSIDGLGRDGWRALLDLGPSRWRDRAEMENFAYGPFSYHLNLARENVRDGQLIVSSDGRLTYFFPGHVDVRYARTCSELSGARFFSFLSSGESLEFAELQRQPTDPLGWIQCRQPEVRLVGEQAGIYAAFVVGGPPAREPTPEECRVAATPGQMLDGVFGMDLTYDEAAALVKRALTVGFVGTRIERTGCSTFRVVVTGIPEDPGVQAEFRREVESVGLEVAFEPALRYPEIADDIPAVPP